MSGKIERFCNELKELLDEQDSGYLTVANLDGVEGVILAAYENSEEIEDALPKSFEGSPVYCLESSVTLATIPFEYLYKQEIDPGCDIGLENVRSQSSAGCYVNVFDMNLMLTWYHCICSSLMICFLFSKINLSLFNSSRYPEFLRISFIFYYN